MPKKTKTEVLPPAPLAVIPDMRAMLDKLVEEKVAEIMSKDAPALFQPYFQSKRVATEIRRNQTVTDHERWTAYYRKWGCDVCGQKKHGHFSLGRCANCHHRTFKRLRAIMREMASANASAPVFEDRAGDLARQALQPLSPPLPPEKRMDLEWIARDAIRSVQKALPAANSRKRSGRSQ
jgi:hypothetical protein